MNQWLRKRSLSAKVFVYTSVAALACVLSAGVVALGAYVARPSRLVEHEEAGRKELMR